MKKGGLRAERHSPTRQAEGRGALWTRTNRGNEEEAREKHRGHEGHLVLLA